MKIESHPFVRALLCNLIKHIGKRRTIVSSCALYVETKRRHWALDHRLGYATAIQASETIEQELAKFLLEADTMRPDSIEEGNCDDRVSSFEAFLQNVRRENRPISTLRRDTDARERSLEQARRLTHLADSYENNDGALAPFPKRMLEVVADITKKVWMMTASPGNYFSGISIQKRNHWLLALKNARSSRQETPGSVVRVTGAARLRRRETKEVPLAKHELVTLTALQKTISRPFVSTRS